MDRDDKGHIGSTTRVKGTVVSGLGEGRYFMGKQGYIQQIQQKLRFTPYAGTLNIKIPDVEAYRINEIKNSHGIGISGFKNEGKEFGGATAYNAELMGVRCAVIMPKMSKHKNVIEIIAEENLRSRLGLSDGSIVTIDVYPEG
ncbi:MAG: CTP-dependent riboflavin kinase [Candidatus Marsarchaeota archaeon]|jgi:riboflavin kinase|nr:CTP-dependent riboflavin kinase [Candidatus Marsarchaeota archaeon]